MSGSLLALALGVAAALALVSCGNDAELLPGETASEINANLDMVKELADSGDCAGAQSAAEQVSEQIRELGGVDKRLKQALRDGADQLNAVVANCVESTTEAVAPASIPEPTERTTTNSSSRGQSRSGEQRTTPTTTTTTETTPTTTTPTPRTTPTPTTPEGGGTGAPGGVSPGSEAGGGQ